MNLKQIRDEAWGIARETATTDALRLWTQAEMNRYINRVYRYIARETQCIRDSITSSVCRIPSTFPTDIAAFTALAATDEWAAQDLAWYNDSGSWLYIAPQDVAGGESLLAYQTRWAKSTVCPYAYPLSPLILDVLECKWTTRQWKLTKVSITKWQSNVWWEQVKGMPTEFATDGDNNTLFLNFRSQTTDTLKLVVTRMPLADLVNDTDIPELRTHYHDFMINGILWQMYSKQDSQTFDGEKAADYKARFDKDVDEIKQQNTIIHQRLNSNHSMDAFR